MRLVKHLFISLIAILLFSESAVAQKDTLPKSEIAITKHQISIDGKSINYTATAGTMLLRDEQNEAIALYGFTAYTKDGVQDQSSRPIMFAYNGGPGSSSVWLHLGVLGPKRTVVNDPGFTPAAPYRLEDNNYSVLDVADLVMIDPVGTGMSRPIGKAKGKDFWGVDQDMRTVSLFIKQFITENKRWNSPKYLLGESYGTMRSAAVANYLEGRLGMALNGVIMVSAVFDIRTLNFAQGDDISYPLNLPTYAATAWYHNKVPNKPASLEKFIQESREFAENEYASALMKGDRLSDAEREKIVERLAYFTGLNKDYIRAADIRIQANEFGQELLRDEGLTVGRLDSRFKGINQEPLSQGWQYDPQSSAISPAYKATFMDYYYNQLKVNPELTYNFSARDGFSDFNWDWSHSANGRGGFPRTTNTGVDMAEAMTKNPNLEILILNGYYDIATPFFGVEYTIDHLGLEPEIKKNITMKYYEAGHMMYTHKPSLIAFKKDVADFVKKTMARP